MYAAKVRDFTESERQLRALQDPAGGPSGMSARVILGRAVRADRDDERTGAPQGRTEDQDYAVALLEDRRRVAGDQRLRGALYSQTRIQDVFNAAILAASRAGDAERVFSILSAPRPGRCGDGLLYRGEFAQGQDQRVLLERALLGAFAATEHCLYDHAGECACRLAERGQTGTCPG